MQPENTDPLPPIPVLPVLRVEHCSQETTDAALAYVWEKRPDLIKHQMTMEASNFDQTYLMDLWHIVDFLQKAEQAGHIKLPQTQLGMLDLFFELSRRMRKVIDIPEYQVRGRPFAPSREGPFPELPSIPVCTLKDDRVINNITQEVADRIIEAAYKLRPQLFYDFSEELRHGFGLGVTFDHLKRTFKEVSKPEDNIKDLINLGGEVNRRIRTYCGIPLV